MKTKTLIIAAVLSMILLTSCREHKEAEKEVEADVKIEKVEEQVEIEEQPEIDTD